MTERDGFYVRYSADMILLGDDKEKLLEILREIKGKLHQIGLKLNESKTCCVSLEEGVDMLGYHFSSTGKSIPTKAVQGLQDRLEMM